MVDWCSEQSKFQTLAPDSYLKNGEAQRGSQPNSLHFHLPNTVEYFIKFENVLGMYSSNLPVIFLCLHNPHHSLIFRYFFTKPGNPLFFKQNVMEWTKAIIQCKFMIYDQSIKYCQRLKKDWLLYTRRHSYYMAISNIIIGMY